MSNQENQQELPLLSVVVNAYNIEKELLDRCIFSVVNQTYTNLEIILVDNRSTDDTGIFCDEWAQKDSRIQVIHRQKRGDKPGRAYTTGEYIHFLDHDDWIHPEMYSKMMSAMLATNSDIARCEFCFVYPDGRIVQRDIAHKTDSIEIIGQKEGVLLILENKKWQTYWWQNIVKKQLFDHYVSPNRVFGDLAGTHILFHHASQTVYLHDVFYYYYQRPGSTINPQNDKGEKLRDYYRGNAHYDRYLFVKHHPEYHSMLHPQKRKALQHALFSLWDMIDYPQYFPDNAYEAQIEQLKTFSFPLRGGFLSFFLNVDLLILKIFPRCYQPYYKLTYRNLKRLYRHIKAK